MTAFCRAAAGVTGKMPERHMAPRTPSPTPGPDFSPGPRAWARVSAPWTGNADGEAEAGRRADRPLPPKGLTRGPPFVPARKTQRLEVILTRGGGGPRQHHDSPATVLLQKAAPAVKVGASGVRPLSLAPVGLKPTSRKQGRAGQKEIDALWLALPVKSPRGPFDWKNVQLNGQ